MNRLVEKGMLQELSFGVNFAYILKDDSLFLPTEYKVLHSQSTGFVRCMKMRYNGHVELYYLISELKPLAAVVGKLDTAAFFTVVRNLFSDVIAARTNGFLSCQNIVLSFDKIFVEPESLKVSLVYLPVSEHVFADYSACEEQLRSDLARMISSMALVSEGVQRLALDLANPGLSLDEIYERLRGGKGGAYEDAPAESGKSKKKLWSGDVEVISTLGGKTGTKGPSVPPYKPAPTAPVPPYKPAPMATVAPPAPSYNPTMPPVPPMAPPPTFAPVAPPVAGGSGPSLTFRPAPDLAPIKKKEGK